MGGAGGAGDVPLMHASGELFLCAVVPIAQHSALLTTSGAVAATPTGGARCDGTLVMSCHDWHPSVCEHAPQQAASDADSGSVLIHFRIVKLPSPLMQSGCVGPGRQREW